MKSLKSWSPNFVAFFILLLGLLGLISTVRLSLDIGRPFGGYLTYYNPYPNRHVLISDTPVWWPGMVISALHPGDQFIAIEGKPYTTANEKAIFAQVFQEGRSTVSLVIERAGNQLEVQSPVVLFSWQYFLEFKLPGFLISFGCFILAIFIFRARPHAQLNQITALYLAIFISPFCIRVPTLFHHDGLLSQNVESSYTWFNQFFGALMLHFALHFPTSLDLPVYVRRILLTVFYFLPLNMVLPSAFNRLILLFSGTPGVFTPLIPYEYSFYVAMVAVAWLFLWVRLIWQVIVSEQQRYRNEAFILLVFWIISLPMTIPHLLNQFAVYAERVSVFWRFFDLRYLFLLFPFAMASILLRYQTFGAVSKFILIIPIIALSGTLASFASAITLLLQTQSLASVVVSPFVPTLSVVLLASTIWTLQSSQQGWFRLLFHRQYINYEAIRQFGQNLFSSHQDFVTLRNTVSDTLCQQFALEKVGLWLWHNQSSTFQLLGHAGQWDSPPPDELVIPAFLLTHPQSIRLANQQAPWLMSLKQIEGIEIVIPLVVTGEPVGLLALGKRWDEAFFDERDLESIELVGQQVTLFLLTGIQIEQLRQVPYEITEAQEHERQRFSSELHDTIQQFLSGLPIHLENIRQAWVTHSSIVDERLNQCIYKAQEATQTLMSIRFNLDIPQLEGGLTSAIDALVSHFRLVYRMNIKWSTQMVLDKVIPQPFHHSLYRVIQQALDNIAEHAQAKQVQIAFVKEEKFLVFRVCDDGIGIDMEKLHRLGKPINSGIRWMEIRMEMMGGKLHIISNPGQGMEVIGWIPMS